MCLKKETASSPGKTSKMTAEDKAVEINTVHMSKKLKRGNVSRVSQSTRNLMKKQQNVKKLRHKVWSEKAQTYIKSSLPEEPSLKLRMCLDILSWNLGRWYS